MDKRFSYLTAAEFQQLQRLAAYCGYLQKRGPLDYPDPAGLVRALAGLPPERWDDLARILAPSNLPACENNLPGRATGGRPGTGEQAGKG